MFDMLLTTFSVSQHVLEFVYQKAFGKYENEVSGSCLRIYLCENTRLTSRIHKIILC